MMSERLGFYKKVMLELNRAVLQQRTEEHELHQLFWECTLRCNLNCRHCGSDCRMLSEKDDMPFADFAKVLDDVRAHQDPSKVMVITTGGEPTMRNDLAQCGAETPRLPNVASIGVWCAMACCFPPRNSMSLSRLD